MVTEFKQLEQRYRATHNEMIDALNGELQRLNCSFLTVQLSSNRRLGSLFATDEADDPSQRVDNWLIDLLETLRNLVGEKPLPAEMAISDKGDWLMKRLVEVL